MHCRICDKNMDGFQMDPRDGRTRPCGTCEEVIRDTVESFDTEAREGLEDYDEHDQVWYAFDPT